MRKVDDMLAAAIGRPEVLRMARAQIAMQHWGEIVGEALADKSFPDRYEKGTLWVVATGSAWAQEIRLRKEDIVRRLNAAASEPGLFLDVRVGVRPFRAR
jgi:predicted nucleic acid-binding Zn ribbon protein